MNPARRPTDTPRKSTLFCPDCAHSSPVDGDWLYRAGETGTRYVCPACGAVVATRPKHRSEDDSVEVRLRP